MTRRPHPYKAWNRRPASAAGAGLAARVRSPFANAALIGNAVMLVLTLLCQVRPDLPVDPFADLPALRQGATE